MRRALTALVAAACLAPLLASCGDDDPDKPLPGNADGPAMLRVKDAESILLTLDDVGDDFQEAPTSPEDAAESYGCLGVLDQAQTNQQFQVESRHEAVKDDYEITVTSRVSTYETLGEPKGDLARFRKAVSSCEDTFENRDGTVYDLEFIFNDVLTTEPAEDQLNVQASGTLTDDDGDGESRDAYIGYAATRVGNNVVAVNVTVFGDYDDPLDDLVRYNDLIIERLVEIAEPVPTESPSVSESSDDESSDG
ncbi:MAG: hypothetical protein WKF79_01825 [Nocardioides sp.]